MICGLSGGVDSAVAAALVQRAVGDQLTCVFVDHGLLRKGEAEQVERDFVAATGIRLVVVDARERFLAALAGVSDPETKRKIIGREFIRVFEEAAREVVDEAGAHGESVDFLVQGTLYPDVVESGGGTGTANIKSHHNVGGLPDDLQFALVEPLRTLFKDEVRQVGLDLGLPPEIVWRHPFPGPGLAIRIVGAVTEDRLAILREADAIAREELTAAGLDRDVWQFPVVLLADVRSVGVQGDGRTYGHPDRAASGVERGRHDRRLVAPALRPARPHLHPHHQRGARGQPRRPRRHQQAAGHHRVGVTRRVRQHASSRTIESENHMEFLFHLIVVLHFVGLAALLGGFLAQIASPDKGVNRLMFDGALTQLVTGLVMVGMMSSGILGEEEKAEVDNTKVAIKLVVVLIITVLAFIGRKKTPPQVPLWATIGALTLVNIVVAVFI